MASSMFTNIVMSSGVVYCKTWEAAKTNCSTTRQCKRINRHAFQGCILSKVGENLKKKTGEEGGG